MQISLINTGKRYNREWIFRHVDFTFESKKKYAITGPNGSGKSTLLQVIAGATLQSEGKILYTTGSKLEPEDYYKQISFCAPYLDLIEEMTAIEFLEFHQVFKPFTITPDNILSIVSLENARAKQIRYFSSGMKQRLKLAQAFFCKSPILFLDEPTSNLDKSGVNVYQQLLSTHCQNKLVIISSNEKHEYESCDEVLDINKYKI